MNINVMSKVSGVYSILQNLTTDEYNQYMNVIKIKFNNMILNQLGYLSSNLYNTVLNFTYGDLMNYLLGIDEYREQNIITDTGRIMLQMDLMDFKPAYPNATFGTMLPDGYSYIKYLMLDILTSGHYVRNLINGIISYNQQGVTFGIKFDLDSLLGMVGENSKLVVDMIQDSSNVLKIKYITLVNPITGYNTPEDALTLISDALVLLNAPYGLQFLKEKYLTGSDCNIIYSQTRSLPVVFNISESQIQTYFYNYYYGQVNVNIENSSVSMERYLGKPMDTNMESEQYLKQSINNVKMLYDMPGYIIGQLSSDGTSTILTDQSTGLIRVY